jgi:Holliday junction resolvase
MRRAARTDGNHLAVITAFRKCGVEVLSLAAIGNGCPDLLCACKRGTWLVEVKNKEGRGERLTPDQVKFHAHWPQRIFIVTDPGEVPDVVIAACKP